MKIKIYQKYFLWALACLIIFLILGFYFNMFLMRQLAPKPTEFSTKPPTFFAKLVDHMSEKSRLVAIQNIEAMSDQISVPKMTLIAADGRILYPDGARLPFEWSTIEKPVNEYDAVAIRPNPPPEGLMPPPPPMGGETRLGGPGPGGPGGELPAGGPPPPPPPRGMMGGLFPPPPGGGMFHMMMRQSHLIRLSGEPVVYLLLEHPRDRMMPPPSEMKANRPPISPPLMGFLSLVLSLVLGIAVAISMIYYSVNKKVKMADDVISELQKGNLKARFEVKRKDEFGQAMLRFNRMADEIEKLVEHLRSVERARTKLLQELTHDLRTPIASLKSFLETLSLKGEKIDAPTKQEMLDLSLSEVQYFERLVEDLLFLAQVNEPNYQKDRKAISMESVIQDEADQINLREKFQGKQVSILTHLSVNSPLISADGYLIRRLIRNAMENSISFAKSKVWVKTSMVGNELVIRFEDDGPGFPADVLKSFGERRHSRQIQNGNQHRISVGLGSVIMKTICDAHHAKITATNAISSNGQTTGAILEMRFPA